MQHLDPALVIGGFPRFADKVSPARCDLGDPTLWVRHPGDLRIEFDIGTMVILRLAQLLQGYIKRRCSCTVACASRAECSV